MAASSAGGRPAGPPVLSADIWDQICSHMSKPTLFQLSLVSRSLHGVAQCWAYRSLTLEAFGTSAERFAKVARSPGLRGLVRELTIDTWIGPGFVYGQNWDYEVPEAFLRTLPYLRCFGKLRALHLRFGQFCGRNNRGADIIEETFGFRYRVLDTICHCVAGMWTRERQDEIDRGMEGERVESMEEEMEESMETMDINYPNPNEDAHLPSGQVIRLRELTIANLADYHEPRLSAAWKAVLALPSLVDLKIFVAAEEDVAAPESETYIEEKYEFFGRLPGSWLAPAVADRLRVLSLFYREFWGWFPQMDFRQVALPQLRVLALGNYVFSHEWQIDWFASVGDGALEELYLDDCPILYRAVQEQPLSSSDPGYPLPEVVLGMAYDLETFEYAMRWHHVLPRWAEAMGALRVFRMGHGSWNEPPDDTMMAMDDDCDYDGVDRRLWLHRAHCRLHCTFACPAPTDETRNDECPVVAWGAGRHLHGAGMLGHRICRMQYVDYEISLNGGPWSEPRSFDFPGYFKDPFELEAGTADKDEAAYGALMAAIEARAGLGLEGLSMRHPS